jgi:hypothetical protein
MKMGKGKISTTQAMKEQKGTSGIISPILNLTPQMLQPQ